MTGFICCREALQGFRAFRVSGSQGFRVRADVALGFRVRVWGLVRSLDFRKLTHLEQVTPRTSQCTGTGVTTTQRPRHEQRHTGLQHSGLCFYGTSWVREAKDSKTCVRACMHAWIRKHVQVQHEHSWTDKHVARTDLQSARRQVSCTSVHHSRTNRDCICCNRESNMRRRLSTHRKTKNLCNHAISMQQHPLAMSASCCWPYYQSTIIAVSRSPQKEPNHQCSPGKNRPKLA